MCGNRLSGYHFFSCYCKETNLCPEYGLTLILMIGAAVIVFESLFYPLK